LKNSKKDIEYYYELDRISNSGLQNLFNESPPYKELLSNNILKSTGHGIYKFTYVGVLNYGTKLIFVLPKYLKKHKDVINLKKEVQLIIKVLIKYSSKYNFARSLDFVNNAMNDQLWSEIEIADFLIKDYHIYGLWFKEVHKKDINNLGEIDWSKTVDEITPWVSEGVPIYFDTYNCFKESNYDHVITQLHKWAINYCIIKYSSLLDVETVIYDFDFDLDLIGGVSGALRILDIELSNSFTDREILLLKHLKALFTENISSSQTNLMLYGSNKFELVWENVCQDIFSHDTSLLSGMIKPKWFVLCGGEPVISEINKNMALRPDLLFIEGQTIFIVDAKYYDILSSEYPQNIELKNVVPTSDISKQIMYQLILEESLKISRENFRNIFVLPEIITSKLIEKIGYVRLPNSSKCSDIEVCVVNPTLAYNYYLGYEKIDFGSELPFVQMVT